VAFIKEEIIRSAELSDCRNYRYSLSRVWDESKPYVLFIGLNPSTADESEDDPTIRKCINYAKIWGYGGLKMANLFAYRATLPSDLKKSENPTGLENNSYIRELSSKAGITIIAWSNDGAYLNRDKEVLKLISNPMCLKINKSGQPSHPLYQKNNLQPIPYGFKRNSNKIKLVFKSIVATVTAVAIVIYLSLGSVLNFLDYVPSVKYKTLKSSLNKSKKQITRLKSNNQKLKKSLAKQTAIFLATTQSFSKAKTKIKNTRKSLKNNIIKKTTVRATSVFAETAVPIPLVSASIAATTVIGITAQDYCETRNTLDNILLIIENKPEKELTIKGCANQIKKDSIEQAKKSSHDFKKWTESSIQDSVEWMKEKHGDTQVWIFDKWDYLINLF